MDLVSLLATPAGVNQDGESPEAGARPPFRREPVGRRRCVWINGKITTSAPAQQLELADWTSVGTGRALHLATLLSGGTRTGEIKVQWGRHPRNHIDVHKEAV